MRRRGKTRSRILYWFRTPPGLKVGRAALDEETAELLAATHPQFEFDWPRILSGQGEAEPVDEPSSAAEGEAHGARPRQERRSQPRALAPTANPPTSADAAPPIHPGPAQSRLGEQGVTRLRGRYRDLVARILAGTFDDHTRAELNSLAERLNPDAWDTDGAVSAALDSYEQALDTLRRALGGGGGGGGTPSEPEKAPV